MQDTAGICRSGSKKYQEPSQTEEGWFDLNNWKVNFVVYGR